jgi:hypothetical protein
MSAFTKVRQEDELVYLKHNVMVFVSSSHHTDLQTLRSIQRPACSGPGVIVLLPTWLSQLHAVARYTK